MTFTEVLIAYCLLPDCIHRWYKNTTDGDCGDNDDSIFHVQISSSGSCLSDEETRSSTQIWCNPRSK